MDDWEINGNRKVLKSFRLHDVLFCVYTKQYKKNQVVLLYLT